MRHSKTAFASSCDGIAESGFRSYLLLVLAGGNMRHNLKKTKSMVVSRSRTNASGYDDLTLGGAELEELKSLRNLEVTFEAKLTSETHLYEVVSKAARSLGIVRWERYLFDCPHVLKRWLNRDGLSSLEYWAPCGCRLRNLIWICWIMLFTVRIHCVRVNFVVVPKKKSQ